ncbi:DMT family transporter [Candidatus Curtissbacteria bacterium]|nr:DMT family transporter [Candidatus Curtissbacteria bacterium]
MKAKAPLGASLVVLSSVFYASYGIWTKLTGDFFDGYTASFLRSILVVLILASIAGYYRNFEPLRLRQNWRYICGMVIASLFTWGPLYFAVLQAGVGITLSVAYVSIVLGMFFFGWLFFGERFTKGKVFSAVLGIIGLALIFSPTVFGLGWIALFAALISGFSSAANIVFTKQIKYGSTQSTIILWTASVLANGLMAFLFGKSFPTFEWQIQWFYLLIFAVTSVIASWSLVRGVKLIDAGAAGILGLLEIVFGVVFGVAFFQERPTAVVILGMVVIVIAAAIPYFRDFNAKHDSLN